jgi:phage tail sheath protein FI
MNIATAMPVGSPANGTYWFDDALNNLDIFEVAMNGSDQEWKKVEHVLYSSAAPLTNSVGGSLADGDYWIDTNEAGYPVIYRHNGSAWIAKNNTDQSTPDGVVFGDITADNKSANSFVGSSDVIADGPDPLFYPVGMSAINMCRSANTVRAYDASATTSWKWRNAASNAVDGAGSFGSKAQRKVIVMGMQASFAHEQLREETIQFRLLAAPGYPELMDEMTTLNADRNETAFIIIDTPFNINPTEAIQWVNGAGAAENGVDGLVSKNAYAAAYYPPVLTTDPVSGASVIAPASHSALYTYAYSDNVSFQWFAPAGLTRGIVQNASNVGYLNSEGEFTPVSLTQGHRDAMYEAELNPIANLPGDGVIVYGQKTLSPVASALDRVNVARLTAYLRERFAIIGRPFLFEQNDTQTRANAASTFNGFLANILAQRGVYDYAVVCDESNNTPARIDRNELFIDVAVEPTKSAEFIYIPVRIVNTGELS